MVGLLYESNEWSDWKLHAELENALGEHVEMINMEDADGVERALACEVCVSRIFASAVFRGHERAAAQMLKLIEEAPQRRLRLINAPEAHRYEISKDAAMRKLHEAGLQVPVTQAKGTPKHLRDQVESWEYPCIIKPDCGGRTTHTSVLHTSAEAWEFLEQAPCLCFIVQDFLPSRAGFLTRVEIINDEIGLVVKRSVASNGLSSYHEGSTYESYPDYPAAVRDAVRAASSILGISFGSFDIIETADGYTYIIDANSVSNVAADGEELLGIDLMVRYAQGMAAQIRAWRMG